MSFEDDLASEAANSPFVECSNLISKEELLAAVIACRIANTYTTPARRSRYPGAMRTIMRLCERQMVSVDWLDIPSLLFRTEMMPNNVRQQWVREWAAAN